MCLFYGWMSAFTCFPSSTSWKASFIFSSGNFPVIIDFTSIFLCCSSLSAVLNSSYGVP